MHSRETNAALAVVLFCVIAVCRALVLLLGSIGPATTAPALGVAAALLFAGLLGCAVARRSRP